MNRLPIRDLILPKPRPELTPSLAPAFRSKARQMVETYIFTDSIYAHFENIFDYVARGYGQGFWVQAEYGAGKTHFLVTLAALLARAQEEDLWNAAQDERIRQERRRLASARLFPVVLSLRGAGSADPYLGRTLLDVLLEEFESALEMQGLSGRVQLTAAQDILAWLETRTTPAIRSEAAAFVQQRTGRTLEGYREGEGSNALAALLSEYFTSAGIRPEVAASVKDRLAHVYRQITAPDGPGYDGILVVIDEYEGWDKSHSTPEERSRDGELLETLGFILPRDLGCHIYTVVASQSAVPAKLQGSGEGDRFINIPLLAQKDQRDYDVIIARRTRDLNESRRPEIAEHYAYYAEQFEFGRGLSEAGFCQVFPFQPRCFEAIRRITARDLPTARSGLLVFWEVLNNAELTAGGELLRLADMLRSPHLVSECLSKSVYKDSYLAYRNADETLANLGLDEDDLPLAHDLLATLYLWYAAYLEKPQPLTLKELAEATLTTPSSDGIRAQDAVALVIDQLQGHSLKFENDTAVFTPLSAEFSVLSAFNEHKRRALRDTHRQRSDLTESLFFTPRETGGAAGLFSEFTLDQTRRKALEIRHLEYTGEVIVASSWRLDHGLGLPKEDLHFRLVILSPHALATLKANDLEDPRIAVVLPGEMTEEIREAAAAYAAWHALDREYRGESGPRGEDVRSWLDAQKSRIHSDLVATHLKLYQSGQLLTAANLGISLRDAFGQGGSNDNRFAYIVERLLANAYPSLPLNADALRSPLRTADVGKLFDGYFNKNARTADVTATRSYGLALGLSHPDAPQRFAPQSPPVFDLIEEMLAAGQGGDLPAWKIYESLSRPPYGLPYALIQLYLAAFVRGRSPRMDLLLKPRHNLHLRNGLPVPRERLTAGNISEWEWKPGSEDKFDALTPGIGPGWNETLHYAQQIRPDLRQSTDQADIDQQLRRLSAALQDLKNDLSTLQRNLENLAAALSAHIPSETQGILQNLAALAGGDFETQADFYERAAELFAAPETLRDAMQSYTRLRSVGDSASEIMRVKGYLDQAALDSAAADLGRARQNLLAELHMERLIADPGAWDGLRAEFRRFQERYRNEYQKRHRDYYRQLGELRARLQDAAGQVQALELFNSIQGLGRPSGADLPGRRQALLEQPPICPLEVAAVSVENSPSCENCRLSLTAQPPAADVEHLLDDLQGALEEKRRQLANETVGKIVREGGRPELEAWFAAVQEANLAGVVTSLDPEFAAIITRGLQEQGIYTFEDEALAELARRHPVIEEKDIPAVTGELRSLLEQAFSQAHRAQPDKKTFRLTLK